MQITQIKPELSCNAALAQVAGWEDAASRSEMVKLVEEGKQKVEEIIQNWKPSVYRLGPSKPHKLDSIEACVKKAMRLKVGVRAKRSCNVHSHEPALC
jgi:hypothetical protein